MVDINIKCSGYKYCHLENFLAGLWYVFFLCFPCKFLNPMWIYPLVDYIVISLYHSGGIFIFYYIVVFHCHCLSQESWFGTVENSEHTKEIYLLIKDMNDYHFERLIKMSLPILHLINHYITHVSYLSKLLNVYTDYHFERLNKMSLPILHLINHYITHVSYLSNY